jgi:hypothetical protein
MLEARFDHVLPLPLPSAEKHLASLSEFLNSDEDGTYYVGHAFILVRISGFKYLVDCVFPRPLFLDSWLFFPELAIDARLLDVDGVFISHLHEDHYDPTFLAQLPKSTPIYVTEGRLGFAEISDSSRYLVKKIPPMQLYAINNKVQVLAIPSDHNSFDSSFILKGKNFSVYQGNDNFLTQEVVQSARVIAGPVDHAYVPYAYVWWYPFCLTSISAEQRKAEAQRLTAHNMQIGLMIGEVLEADLIIPSAGNLVYFDNTSSGMNREIASPFDFVDYVIKRKPEFQSRVKVLLAGDSCLKVGGKQHIRSAETTRESYFHAMDDFLQSLDAQRKPARKRDSIAHQDCEVLQKRLALAPYFSFNWTVFFLRSDLPNHAIQVNLRTKEVQPATQVDLAEGTIVFKLEPHAFELWLKGSVTFEDILNSQRFLVARNPEVFNREIWEVIRNYF